MLDSIKSTYFKKNIFMLLDEIRKLKIINYNKSFQNMIGIELIHYMNLSKKYVIFDGNKMGKEYSLDVSTRGQLLFEGEYLNGKRNGRGREYGKDNNLLFEGEYLNGKRNGKGKEYYDNGKLKYDGEYLNGIRNGKGKKYDDNGKLKFEGEYINGKRNGKGKEYNKFGSIIYEGII